MIDNRATRPGTLIATVGGQPQVVTFALDVLLARGEPINEVVAVHLSTARPRVRRALERLAAEFPQDTYRSNPCRYRTVPVRAQGRIVDDILDEPSASAVLATMHELVALLKQQGRTLHLCIAGGLLQIDLLERASYSTITSEVVTHRYAPGSGIRSLSIP